MRRRGCCNPAREAVGLDNWPSFLARSAQRADAAAANGDPRLIRVSATDTAVGVAGALLLLLGIAAMQSGEGGGNQSPKPNVSPSAGTGTPDPDYDPNEKPRRTDPRAQERLDNALSGYQTQRFQVGNQTFQLDKAGMRHILERHSPEYWDGSVKTTQTFFRSGIRSDDVVAVVKDLLGQNRNLIISNASRFEFELTGSSGGTSYHMAIYQSRIVQLTPLP